jgi:putative component of membrane protein insertase Oxa1/YidC/SpoIIIJ protein YidD
MRRKSFSAARPKPVWRWVGFLWFGVLSASSPAAGVAGMELALDCYRSGDWTTCRRECRRTLAADPTNLLARIMSAATALRQDAHDRAAREELTACTTEAAAGNLKALAHYEIGRAALDAGDFPAAYRHLHRAFLDTAALDLYLASADSLTQLFARQPRWAAQDLTLADRVRALESFQAPREETADVRTTGARSAALPAFWLVSFYRRQIGPALGDRCRLEPSCSEYFRQAAERHGLLSLPLIADRLAREPGVTAAAREVIATAGGERIADPLEAHDDWLRRGRETR